MVGHGESSAGSYLADPTSPNPSHFASIVATSTVRVNGERKHKLWGRCMIWFYRTFKYKSVDKWSILNCLISVKTSNHAPKQNLSMCFIKSLQNNKLRSNLTKLSITGHRKGCNFNTLSSLYIVSSILSLTTIREVNFIHVFLHHMNNMSDMHVTKKLQKNTTSGHWRWSTWRLLQFHSLHMLTTWSLTTISEVIFTNVFSW